MMKLMTMMCLMLSACSSGDEASNTSMRQFKLYMSPSGSYPLVAAINDGMQLLNELDFQRIDVPATGFACKFVDAYELNKDGSCDRQHAIDSICSEIDRMTKMLEAFKKHSP